MITLAAQKRSIKSDQKNFLPFCVFPSFQQFIFLRKMSYVSVNMFALPFQYINNEFMTHGKVLIIIYCLKILA